VPRGREPPPPPPSGRDAGWPAGAHQQPGGWQGPHPKTTQGPPPPQSWSPAPQTQPPHHLSMRDDRGYGSQPMQGRYMPPSSRPPESATQAAPYGRYSSTPVQPRDPREPPGRSYTPVGYDARGPPPPPPGPAYGAPDPRDLGRDPRDPRDPRDIMGRGGLRPQEYDRHQDRYGR
jgi:hypothetical protein